MNRQERRALRKREAIILKPQPGMRDFWKALPDLRKADIVVAVLPDESHVLAKGRELLEEVVTTGISKPDTLTAFFPAPSAEFAEAMRSVLEGSLH